MQILSMAAGVTMEIGVNAAKSAGAELGSGRDNAVSQSLPMEEKTVKVPTKRHRRAGPNRVQVSKTYQHGFTSKIKMPRVFKTNY